MLGGKVLERWAEGRDLHAAHHHRLAREHLDELSPHALRVLERGRGRGRAQHAQAGARLEREVGAARGRVLRRDGRTGSEPAADRGRARLLVEARQDAQGGDGGLGMRGRDLLHQGEGGEALGGRHLGKDGARDRRQLGERGGEPWVDAREGAEQRTTNVGGQLRGRRRKLAVDDAGVPRRGGGERARGREEEGALGGRPRREPVRQRREERALLGLAGEGRTHLGPGPVVGGAERRERAGRGVEEGLREEGAAPAARVVEPEPGRDPRAQALDPVRAPEDGRRALEEGRRQPTRDARDLAAHVTPGGQGVEAAQRGGRDGEVRERAVAARGIAGRDPLAQREPARRALGAEAVPRLGRVPVGAEREQRGDLAETVAGREECGVRRLAERGGAAVGFGQGRVGQQVVREPAPAHARQLTRRSPAPARRWRAGSRRRR